MVRGRFYKQTGRSSGATTTPAASRRSGPRGSTSRVTASSRRSGAAWPACAPCWTLTPVERAPPRLPQTFKLGRARRRHDYTYEQYTLAGVAHLERVRVRRDGEPDGRVLSRRVQCRSYWVLPKSTSRAWASIGASDRGGTASPRWTAGRAFSSLIQRAKLGKSASETPYRSWPRRRAGSGCRRSYTRSRRGTAPARAGNRARRTRASPRCEALDRVGQLVRGVVGEVVELAQRGPHVSRLEEHPLEDLRPASGVAREQPAGLLGQVRQDGARLEHREVTALMIDDRGNPVVGADAKEVRGELLTSPEVHQAHRVGQTELLEGDRDLVTVGCSRRVEVDPCGGFDDLAQRSVARVVESIRSLASLERADCLRLRPFSDYSSSWSAPTNPCSPCREGACGPSWRRGPLRSRCLRGVRATT